MDESKTKSAAKAALEEARRMQAQRAREQRAYRSGCARLEYQIAAASEKIREADFGNVKMDLFP